MDVIKFKVNGVEHTVSSNDVASDCMLLEYLRNYLQLRGTKYMCREGGCGACMVTAAKTPGSPHVAINSCLTSITSCHGWDIRTIEGLGNRKDGYHPLQTTLAECHASQCGYCTPGWIMSMHGLMESNKELTMLEIEKSVSSNLCRCTGYRAILDGLKKFAKDCPKEDKIMNVKDLSICKTSGNCCQGSNCAQGDDWCMVREDDCDESRILKIILKDGKIWYRPRTLQDVLDLLQMHLESYMLVGGNTAKGVYPIHTYPNYLIDVHHIQELRVNKVDQNLIVGAGYTLTEFVNILEEEAKRPEFSYLSTFVEHIGFVAHLPLRNVGTVAGNLMIKHTHNVFQSDLYLTLDTVGAVLTIVDCHGDKQTVAMNKFLTTDMKGKVIINVMFRPLSSEYKLFTYKLMPRAQSTHAIVNFGFLCKLDESNIIKDVRIRYGALSVNFDSAVATERCLIGRPLNSNDTLQTALRVLDGEMIVDAHPPEPSVEYRRHIAKALLFKAFLTLSPTLGPRCESAIVNLHHSRPCSSGKQTYTTDPLLWPLSKPIQKLEATIQCAGEAKYIDDMPSFHNEVFGAFVLSTVALGTIIKLDPSEALKEPGVLAFYNANDIPGLNSFTPVDGALTSINEEVLCSGIVKYHSQPIGIIVAETQNIADRASKLVKVKYCNVTKPVLDIKEAIKDPTRNILFAALPATLPGLDIYKIIPGSTVMYGQYPFPMETLVSIAKPTEEGLEVHVASQWLDGPHTMISRALNIDQNKIDVHCRRIGGSYGYKISRCIQGAVACSLVAYKLNRPCRFIQPLTTNITAFGKRMPNYNVYEVAVNKTGKIQYINTTIYTDNGHAINEPAIFYGLDVYYNCYDASKFDYKAFNTMTDTPKNTFCRGPGTLEAIASIEYTMERISYELSLDPIAVRLANLDKTKYGVIEEMVEALKTSAEFTSRRAAVDSFNTQNRWKKRGLRMSVCRWPIVGALIVDVNLSIYHADASVVITHGGAEMGQGLNTKVAQVAAYLLKIPIEKIEIKGNNTIIAPNSFVTGGSVSCDSIIIGLRRCIDQLNAKLEPIRAKLTDPNWTELITLATSAFVDLQFHGYVSALDAQSYDICGAALCEVEVDVITGEYEVLRLDILQDVGASISPEIDVGQIEGAFVMGMGYWTCEKLVYDPDTGAILTDRSWDYHLIEARDIPRDLRVTFWKSYSNDLILGSKGIGEPPICLSVVVPFAIREAMVHARQECGIPTTEWFDIDGAFSYEKVCMAMKTNTKDFKIE